MPDFDESEGDSESSGGGFPSFGSLATGAIAGAAAAKHGVDKLGDAVEGFSPVDDQDTVDQQRRDKEFQEKLLGQSERIPGYNAPADEGDSREFSLDEKGGPPPMPPEREPRLFNDSPDAHHSGEDFAERMRRLRGNQ